MPKKSKRQPFSVEQLKALLHATSPEVRGGKDWAFWWARIAMLHGFRLTEPLGLQVRDLFKAGNRWCFRIQTNAYRTVKTNEATRDLPVHPDLIKLGLLSLANGKEPTDLLLPKVPSGKNNSFNAAQKRLGRLIDDAVSNDPNVTAHSLRHNFRDAQRRVDMPHEIAARLGGWKVLSAGVSTSMEAYGNGAEIGRLAKWIARIRYPGIDPMT